MKPLAYYTDRKFRETETKKGYWPHQKDRKEARKFALKVFNEFDHSQYFERLKEVNRLLNECLTETSEKSVKLKGHPFE